ncbi:MAG TPA: threonine synthase, partial [Caulobacteraceae bacterium]|nr:threonine synthase [Caulobacteraceae bacterium]
MNYVSTRGAAPPVSFLDAVLAGLAPDGGLYVPETWPTFTEAEIAALAGRPYAEVAAEVIGRFAEGEIAPAELAEMCADAYASFSHAAVVPLIQLAPGRFLLELFHGPSLAFKDVAMQLLARLYDHALGQVGRKLTIVCATSGDTGGAAVEAFRGRANVRIVAMFPQGRISEVQRRFMTTAEEDNVACLAVKGTFDDCQAMLKEMFRDAQFAKAVDLSGVNSINFARIAAQCVYYFTAAVALGAPARKVAFAVPTGNFGDAYAGYAATRMGLPIERIVIGTNCNDILSRALDGGRYARGDVAATSSPAMDIQAASNFERLYFETTDRDPLETARAFEAFSAQGAIDVPPRTLTAMRALFAGASVSEDETARTILATLNETGELVDP